MKRILQFTITALLGVLLLNTTVYAAGPSIDKSNAAKGLITIQFDGMPKGIKAMVEKGDTKYTYDISTSITNIPLQMGSGNYKVSVLENVEGTKYKMLTSETVSAPSIDEKALYTNSIQMVNYNAKTKAVVDFAKKLTTANSDNDKSKIVYDFLVAEFSYDFDKAKSVANNYLPVIDDIYAKKKGICYDYSSVLAGVLRSAGIPTKLVMGYAAGVTQYHAWNEICIDGKWIVVDSTTDSQLAKAKVNYSMAKTSSDYKVTKVY